MTREGKNTTLGVDLSAQSKETAYCLIEWAKPKARIIKLCCGADDTTLLEMFGRSNKIGIDAPFGWPTAFSEAVYEHQRRNVWPAVPTASLRYRTTDHIVQERIKRWPLSVSSDRIGVTAMRAARLLSENGRIDRSGRGRFVEVYPAAALHIWGFPSTGYKKKTDAEKRREITRQLMSATKAWLDWPGDVQQACEKSDDTLDAVVAALVTRAAAIGQIEPIPQKHRADAKREGWIALPRAGSLASLAAAV